MSVNNEHNTICNNTYLTEDVSKKPLSSDEDHTDSKIKHLAEGQFNQLLHSPTSPLVDVLPDEMRREIFLHLDGGPLLSLFKTAKCFGMIKEDPKLYQTFLVDQALKVMIKRAHGIEDTSERCEALHKIATLESMINPDKAMNTVESISEPYWRSLALVQIAKEEKRPALAQALFEQALHSARSINVSDDKDKALSFIANSWTLLSREEAYAVTELIKNEQKRNAAAIEIVRQQASLDVEQAKAFAYRIQNIDSRERALCEIVQAQASTQLEKALELIDAIQSVKNKSRALFKLVKVQALTDPRQALDTAALIKDKSYLSRARCAIVKAEALIDIEHAQILAKTISKKDKRQDAFGWIVKAQASTNLQQALATVQAHLSGYDKDNALREIVKQQLLRNPQQAVIDVDLIENPLIKDTALYEVVKSEAAHDLERAINTASRIRQDSIRANARCVIAGVQALNAPDEALTTAAWVKSDALESSDNTPQNEVLASIVKIHASVDPEKALQIASQIKNEKVQALALHEASKTVEDRQAARKLIQHALAAACKVMPIADQIAVLNTIVEDLLFIAAKPFK